MLGIRPIAPPPYSLRQGLSLVWLSFPACMSRGSLSPSLRLKLQVGRLGHPDHMEFTCALGI